MNTIIKAANAEWNEIELGVFELKNSSLNFNIGRAVVQKEYNKYFAYIYTDENRLFVSKDFSRRDRAFAFAVSKILKMNQPKVEKKISEKDMEFLTGYAMENYPFRDEIKDFSYAVGAVRELNTYAYEILSKELEKMKSQLKKQEDKLNRLKKKYGRERVMNIVFQFDNYSD